MMGPAGARSTRGNPARENPERGRRRAFPAWSVVAIAATSLSAFAASAHRAISEAPVMPVAQDGPGGPGGRGVDAGEDPPRGWPEIDELLSRLGATGLRLDAAAAVRRESKTSPPGPTGRELVALAESWIESEASAEDRLERLARLERLTEAMPAAEAERLRFALATGRYLAAAAAADRWRSGTDAPRSPEVLAGEFGAAAESFLRLAARAERERSSTASLLLRASGIEGDLLSEAQQRLEARGLRASFLAGWSILQRALLLGDASAAAEAAEILEPLLDTGTSDPRPRDVSIDRRSDLGFAQTVLGFAIARGIVRGGDEGRRWLELLEIDSVDPELRAAVPVWAMLMRTAAGDPEGGHRLVESWRRRSDADAGWYAITLLEALRRGEQSPNRSGPAEAWARLAQSAASGLLDLGREDRLRRLADGARSDGPWRPDGPLGEVLQALRGMDGVEGDGRIAAARALLDAATQWPGDATGLRLEAIVGLLGGGAPLEAWSALESDEGRFEAASATEREQAAWLRLVAIDRLRTAGLLAEAGLGDASWAVEATAFLEAHPDSERASLVAIRLGGEDLPLERLVDLALSGDAGVRRSVRSTLARRIAEVRPQDRGEILDAWTRLGPIALERDPRAAADGEVRREAYEAIAVLVAGDAEDLARARRMLARLDPDAPGSDLDERTLARGLAAEVALASGDPATAQSARRAALRAEAERRRDGTVEAIVATPESWMRRVESGWRRSREAAARSRSLAEAWAMLAIEASAEVLDRDGASAPASEIEMVAAALATAGEAERYALGGVRSPEAAEAWRQAAQRFATGADREFGAPWRGAAIEAVASSSAAAGRWREVLEAARRLLAGRARGSEGWNNAKALQIEALAELDPGQARAVLDQHRVLDPAWDQGVVGMRLRRLHDRLPEAAP
jgi:hypothetical protein